MLDRDAAPGSINWGKEITYDTPALLREGGDDFFDAGNMLYDDPDFDALHAPDPGGAHDRNLAGELPSARLAEIVQKVKEGAERDLQVREGWYQEIKDGVESLGVDRREVRAEPFKGAASVSDPTMIQALVEFQSRIRKEIVPKEGPVEAIALGANPPPDLTSKLKDLSDAVNYDLVTGDKSYLEGFDRAVLIMGFLGSVVRKRGWRDGRPTWETISPLDFVRPYNSTSLDSAPRKTHVIKLYPHELDANIKTLGWLRIDMPTPDESALGALHIDTTTGPMVNKIVGIDQCVDAEDDRHIVFESHVYMDIEGDGLAPYIVTYEPTTGAALAVVRNWDADDARKRPRTYFLQYDFLPWFGAYGIGLLHVLGGIAKAATGALRCMLDAARLTTIPGGLYSSAARLGGDGQGGTIAFRPGEWVMVNITGAGDPDLTKYIVPFPVKGIDPALPGLLQTMVDRGKEFGSSVVRGLADSSQGQPVGTTMAMLEQQTVVFSLIYSRFHSTYEQECNLTRQSYYDWMDETDTKQTTRGAIVLSRQDFAGGILLKPRADASSYSQLQKITQAQAALQLCAQAQQAGVKVDMRVPFLRMAQILGIPESDKLFPAPDPHAAPPPPLDPASEFQAVLRGQPVAAAQGQNHEAHIRYHMAKAADPIVQPMLLKNMPALEALMSDHAAQQAVEEAAGGGQPPAPPQAPAPQGPPPGLADGGAPPQGAFAPPPQGPQGPPPPDPYAAWLKAQTAASMAEQFAQRRMADPAFGGQGAFAQMAHQASDNARQAADAAKLQLETEKVHGTLAVQRQKVEGDQQIRREQLGLDHDKHLHGLQVQREGIGMGHETALQGLAHKSALADRAQAHQAATAAANNANPFLAPGGMNGVDKG